MKSVFHEWPDDEGQIVDFDKLIEPIVKCFSHAYTMVRINKGKRIPYEGYELGNTFVPAVKEQFGAGWTQDEGKNSALRIIVGVCFNLGFENGRRSTIQKIRDLMRGTLRDLQLLRDGGATAAQWTLKDGKLSTNTLDGIRLMMHQGLCLDPDAPNLGDMLPLPKGKEFEFEQKTDPKFKLSAATAKKIRDMMKELEREEGLKFRILRMKTCGDALVNIIGDDAHTKFRSAEILKAISDWNKETAKK